MLGYVVGEIVTFILVKGNFIIIVLALMKKTKNNAIVGNIGHIDNEIMVDTEGSVGSKVVNIKPKVDCFVFLDVYGMIILASGRLMNLGSAMGHPFSVMSRSLIDHVPGQLDLLDNWKTTK
eukprot:13262625-Heterocapsa_arctica.AAC.1